MALRPASMKVRALQWLAQREHSRSELRTKLLRLLRPAHCAAGGGDVDVEPADAAREVDALLDWLAEHGHLSQERFVESRVHARQRRFGNLRIHQELRRHDVALDAEAEAALKGSEFERAQQVWQRKFGTVAGDAAARVRQVRFLAGRGFTPEVIRRIVRGTGVESVDDAGNDAGPRDSD